MVGSTTNQVGSSDLSAIFATRTTARLLAVFSLKPERVFYQKELVDLTGSSLYLVQRELERLARVGLVVRWRRGKHVEYRAERSHPAFPGLRDALLRTTALGDRLRGALAQVADVRLAFVFGSVARGDAGASSDLDLLIVGDLGLREVAREVVPLLRDLGREPNIVVMTLAELRERSEAGEHFVTTVLAGPRLWLVGDDDALAAALDRGTSAPALRGP